MSDTHLSDKQLGAYKLCSAVNTVTHDVFGCTTRFRCNENAW